MYVYIAGTILLAVYVAILMVFLGLGRMAALSDEDLYRAYRRLMDERGES